MTEKLGIYKGNKANKNEFVSQNKTNHAKRLKLRSLFMSQY